MSQAEKDQETLEGYIVDLACLRKYPYKEMLHRSETHSTTCALMGHCIESGYGLVDQEGSLYPLDTHATPLVVSVLEESEKARGIRLRIGREMRDQEMQTTTVEEI